MNPGAVIAATGGNSGPADAGGAHIVVPITAASAAGLGAGVATACQRGTFGGNGERACDRPHGQARPAVRACVLKGPAKTSASAALLCFHLCRRAHWVG